MKQYPETEIKAWLELPLSQHYFGCLKELAADLVHQVGMGASLDPANADHTFASYNQAIGKYAGLITACEPYEVLSDFDLILEDKHG